MARNYSKTKEMKKYFFQKKFSDLDKSRLSNSEMHNIVFWPMHPCARSVRPILAMCTERAHGCTERAHGCTGQNTMLYMFLFLKGKKSEFLGLLLSKSEKSDPVSSNSLKIEN